MTEVTRNVTEIAPADRQALEHVLGAPLMDGQQVMLRVASPGVLDEGAANGEHDTDDDTLPEWCNVYEGLSDQEIADIEAIMLTRADLTRSSD